MGSSADIDVKTLPESEKGLQVIKEWLRDFFYTASYSELGRLDFLTAITETATLTLLLEGAGARAYFSQARCITTERPAEFLRKGDRYVVHDLMHFLVRGDTTALSAGVIFIK